MAGSLTGKGSGFRMALGVADKTIGKGGIASSVFMCESRHVSTVGFF